MIEPAAPVTGVGDQRSTASRPGHRTRLVPRRLRAGLLRLRVGSLRDFWGAVKLFVFTSQRVAIYARDLDGVQAPPELDPRAEIRRGTAEDLARFRATHAGGEAELYRDAIDGAEPFVAYWEGRPAHIAWVYDHRLPVRFVRLQPGEAELGYGYTLPEFRTRGLYALTANVMAAELARRGLHRLYGHVIVHTAAYALGLDWAVRRAGFRKVRTVRYLRVLGVQLLPHLSL